jgi:hypothetical protein
VGVMQKPVEDGIRDRGVTDPSVPVLDRQLGSNNSGVLFGAVVRNFEQIFSTGGCTLYGSQFRTKPRR